MMTRGTHRLGLAAIACSVLLWAAACGGAAQPASGAASASGGSGTGSGSAYGTVGGSSGSTAATSSGTSASASASAASGAATVSVASAGSLGSVLTDAQGMTLYEFTADSSGTSKCSGTCAKIWPPLTVTAAPTGGTGVTGTLGTIQRSDGSQQVTCNGLPLYHFSGDKQPGDTKGQGILKKWYVVRPDCSMVTGS